MVRTTFYPSKFIPRNKYSRKSPYPKALPKEKTGVTVAAMRKVAKEVLNRAAETKATQFTSSWGLYNIGSASFLTNNIFCLTPNGNSMSISQGTTEANRIGNKISTHKCTFKFLMHPTGYNVITNAVPMPMEVVMWIFTDKMNPTAVGATYNPTGDFFEAGSSTGALTGTGTDLMKAINNDRYRLLEQKTWKLGMGAYGGTTANADAQYFHNNDFKYNHKVSLDVTKHMPKIIDYVDNAVDPTSRKVWAMFEVVYANGQTMSANSIGATLWFQQEFQFKDL